MNDLVHSVIAWGLNLVFGVIGIERGSLSVLRRACLDNVESVCADAISFRRVRHHSIGISTAYILRCGHSFNVRSELSMLLPFVVFTSPLILVSLGKR